MTTNTEASNETPPPGLRVIDSNEVFAIAEFDRCMLTIWRLQPTRETFGRRDKEVSEFVAKHRGACGYIELIEPGSKPPPNELRKAGVEVFRQLGKDLSCIAFVVDGAELRSAMVRAILATMSFFVPATQPSKIFKRFGDMSEWVRQRIGEADPTFSPRLTAAFEHLRRA
jgi:hypothetical protein